jgi:AraC-like DNA-binding protein
MAKTAAIAPIELLSDVPDADIMPVLRAYYENWKIRAFSRERSESRNYFSPHRRDFYKVSMITHGQGTFTIGTRAYTVTDPIITFLPPSEIISWKGTSATAASCFCLFKKSFIDEHPALRALMDKYRLFHDADKQVVRLKPADVAGLIQLFKLIEQEGQAGGAQSWPAGGMQEGQESGAQKGLADRMQEGVAGGRQKTQAEALPGSKQVSGTVAEDTMQAYLQLIMLASIKIANHPMPDAPHEGHAPIFHFFELLENEMGNVNYSSPIRIKTVKEFADSLSLTPNYLNTLLKRYTGQNVSAHIKGRLLDEGKALLLQTDWTLEDIGYALGFANQPNFSAFFKKSAGMTPADFRRGQR